jgi:hypothetical protein
MPAHAISGQSLPRPARTSHPAEPWPHLKAGIGRLGVGLFTLPFWLAVVMVAALALVLMLVMDAALMLVDAVQPGPAPERRRWRTGALF